MLPRDRSTDSARQFGKHHLILRLREIFASDRQRCALAQQLHVICGPIGVIACRIFQREDDSSVGNVTRENFCKSARLVLFLVGGRELNITQTLEDIADELLHLAAKCGRDDFSIHRRDFSHVGWGGVGWCGVVFQGGENFNFFQATKKCIFHFSPKRNKTSSVKADGNSRARNQDPRQIAHPRPT